MSFLKYGFFSLAWPASSATFSNTSLYPIFLCRLHSSCSLFQLFLVELLLYVLNIFWFHSFKFLN